MGDTPAPWSFATSLCIRIDCRGSEGVSGESRASSSSSRKRDCDAGLPRVGGRAPALRLFVNILRSRGDCWAGALLATVGAGAIPRACKRFQQQTPHEQNLQRAPTLKIWSSSILARVYAKNTHQSSAGRSRAKRVEIRRERVALSGGRAFSCCSITTSELHGLDGADGE